MFLTLGIISTLSILLIISGIVVFFLDDEEFGVNLFTSGVVIGLLVGVLGWGVCASVGYEKMIVTEIQPDTIVKTRTTAFVEFTYEYDENIVTKTYDFSEHVDYVEVDSMKFYKVIYYDYYGNEQDIEITKEKKYSNCDFGVKIKAN